MIEVDPRAAQALSPKKERRESFSREDMSGFISLALHSSLGRHHGQVKCETSFFYRVRDGGVSEVGFNDGPSLGLHASCTNNNIEVI